MSEENITKKRLLGSKPERGKEESLLAISAGGFLTLIN